MNPLLLRAYRAYYGDARSPGPIRWFHEQLAGHGVDICFSSARRYLNGERTMPDRVKGVLLVLAADAELFVLEFNRVEEMRK